MFGRGCVENLQARLKSRGKSVILFHPIDEDERLLSVASNSKVLNVQVSRAPKFLMCSHFDDLFSLRLSHLTQWFSPKIGWIILFYFISPNNMLLGYGSTLKAIHMHV